MRKASLLFLFVLLAVPLILASAQGCGPDEKTPLDGQDVGDQVGEEDGQEEEELREEVDDANEEIELGGECEEDEDCNDHVDCTSDSCENGYCVNTPDDSFCDDGLKCNGQEVCNAEEGCLPGEIFRECDDRDPCTLDICVEGGPGEAPYCERRPLDRDADGHVDIRCEGGDDCNDLSDRVYPGARERCFDGLDNDCNGFVDRNDHYCHLTNDTCASPRELAIGVIEEGFNYGAENNPEVEIPCDWLNGDEVTYSFTLEEQMDVFITVAGREWNYVFVALQNECGVGRSTIFCNSGYSFTFCQRGMEAGTYYLVVSTEREGIFDITVDATPPGPPPAGDSCANPIDVTGGGRWEVDLSCMGNDLPFSCAAWASYRDAFFTFTITELHDVQLRVSSTNLVPYVTIYGSNCAQPTPSLVCDIGYPFDRRITRLEPGTYTIGVEASTPGRFVLDLEILPPSESPANDTCAGAIDVSAGGVFRGSLLAAADNAPTSCLPPSLDVFYRLSLAEPKDVRLMTRGVGMFEPALAIQRVCGDPTSEVRCLNTRPAATYMRALPAGDYWIVVEGRSEGEFELQVDIMPPTSVCGGAEIIETTTEVSGSTTGRPNDFEARCGWGARSPDVPYILRLAAPSNVTARITRGTFDTVLHLRSICDDPTSEIACDDDGGVFPLSLLSLTGLAAGDYILVVDGFGPAASGDYTMSVTITPM